MSDTWSSITIFSMTRIEPHVQREGLALWLRLHKVNALIHDHFCFVANASVGLFFKKWIAADRLELIKMILLPKRGWHLSMPFPKVARSITVGSQEIGIQSFHCFRTSLITAPRCSISSTG